MKRKHLVWGGLTAIFLTVAWFVAASLFADRNLVTLNVRNMDVREVFQKIENQTRTSILVHKDVEGKITLNVHKVPLDEVLAIIDDQASSRWNVLWALHTSSSTLEVLKRALRGEMEPPVLGWTNLQSRGFFRGGGGGFGGGGFGGGGFGGGGPGGPFGEQNSNQNQHVSLQIEGKDVFFVTLALARYAQARVVPEDGTSALVNLKLNKATVADAVARLAKQANRSWAKLYYIQGFGQRRGPGGPGELASREGNEDRRGGDDGGRRRDFTELTEEQRDEMRKHRETMAEELKQALPPEERQRVELAQQQMEQQRQEMQNLSPEQRRERFQQMGGGRGESRQVARVKNSTPEQRMERYRQIEQRRQRGQQGGQGGRGGR